MKCQRTFNNNHNLCNARREGTEQISLPLSFTAVLDAYVFFNEIVTDKAIHTHTHTKEVDRKRTPKKNNNATQIHRLKERKKYTHLNDEALKDGQGKS